MPLAGQRLTMGRFYFKTAAEFLGTFLWLYNIFNNLPLFSVRLVGSSK